MSWTKRYQTLRRVGVRQIALSRMWIALKGDQRIRSTYDVQPGELVIDVGAYEGEFSAEMRRDCDAAVIAIEPVPLYATNLKRQFDSDPLVTVLPVALGRERGTTRISLSADGSSGWVNGTESFEVPIVDVASIVGDKEVALLKINAEGAEFDVLDRLIETRQIRQVKCMQIQFHRFVPDAVERRRLIRARLKHSHACSWNVPWVWEQWARRP